MMSVNLMFRDRIGAEDVESALQAFPLAPDDPYGWTVWPQTDRQVNVELGEDHDFKSMPKEMVRACANLLGISSFSFPRRPRSRVVLIFFYNPPSLTNTWPAAQEIARSFAQRWKVVLDDNADGRWLVSPNLGRVD
jgi:hypothetical protein